MKQTSKCRKQAIRVGVCPAGLVDLRIISFCGPRVNWMRALNRRRGIFVDRCRGAVPAAASGPRMFSNRCAAPTQPVAFTRHPDQVGEFPKTVAIRRPVP